MLLGSELSILVSASANSLNDRFWPHAEVVDSNEDSVMTVSKFEKKIEPSSAKMYFHYYGQLLHQQNMMQDYVRTGVLSYLLFEVL